MIARSALICVGNVAVKCPAVASELCGMMLLSRNEVILIPDYNRVRKFSAGVSIKTSRLAVNIAWRMAMMVEPSLPDNVLPG